MPRVSLADTDKVFEVGKDEILYDALDDRGETLPHGCLSGSCGACRVEVLVGPENLLKPGVIESDTIEAVKTEFISLKGKEFVEGKTIRLSCRAKVLGDVTIRPLK